MIVVVALLGCSGPEPAVEPAAPVVEPAASSGTAEPAKAVAAPVPDGWKVETDAAHGVRYAWPPGPEEAGSPATAEVKLPPADGVKERRFGPARYVAAGADEIDAQGCFVDEQAGPPTTVTIAGRAFCVTDAEDHAMSQIDDRVTYVTRVGDGFYVLPFGIHVVKPDVVGDCGEHPDRPDCQALVFRPDADKKLFADVAATLSTP